MYLFLLLNPRALLFSSRARLQFPQFHPLFSSIPVAGDSRSDRKANRRQLSSCIAVKEIVLLRSNFE
ncbi:hypothetical protein ACSBR2_030258 [Camellia fascicularis]